MKRRPSNCDGIFLEMDRLIVVTAAGATAVRNPIAGWASVSGS